MKRPCFICGKIKDDGLPLPAGATAEQMLKSHKVCKECTPAYEANIAAQLRGMRAQEKRRRRRRKN